MGEIAPPSTGELLPRLPRTFVPALNEQLRNWDLLFPAEQRQIRAQIDWLSRLPGAELKRLVAPILAVESKMELPRWQPGSAGMTVEEVGLLARSPLYPQWRAEVENVFSRIEEGVAPSGGPVAVPKLLVCVLPRGLPLAGHPLWPEAAKDGAWVALDRPWREMLSAFARAIAKRPPRAGVETIETTWVFECDTGLSPLAESSSATVFSWAAMAGARREFLNRLNTIRRDLKDVDHANQELKRMDLSRILSPAIGSKPRLREFARALLLSGNGSLVFNNSFVQWGASEALRRVQPQALIAAFGIRPKLKPFSSTVLFEDQGRSNPAPDEDDPAGSLVDALKLSEYVCLAAQRVSAYQARTLVLLAACDLDRILVLGPRPPAQRLAVEDLSAFALRWLEG